MTTGECRSRLEQKKYDSWREINDRFRSITVLIFFHIRHAFLANPATHSIFTSDRGRIFSTSGLSHEGGGVPRRTASRFRAAVSDILERVCVVALPMCGTRTALSKSRRGFF